MLSPRSSVAASVALCAAAGVLAPVASAAPAAAAPTPAVAAAPAAPAAAATNGAYAGVPVAARGPAGAYARKYLGASRSSLAWHSGAWVGGWMSATRATRWGTWRGTPSDVTLTFPESRTWADIQRSTWHIDTFKGFRGTLVYGLPLLPKTAKPAQLRAVAAGKHDATFAKVARDLRARGRGKTVVRIGWEANGTWMPYSVTAGTAATYRAAFRRVAKVMEKQAPGLLFSFDVNCGTTLKGQRNRLDSLNRLYPGSDVVDMVGCSAYDWDVLGATTEAGWRRALKPGKGVGLGDVAAFARAKRKGLAISEWGLAGRHRDGHGDNPFYIRKMKQFFTANADILVLESYFNVAEKTDTASSLWPEAPLNPRSAAVYRALW
ncbi:hypothetical protein [Agilicoccus flavus]|uniref:hypothetical protein n=1 Tax=Agilicoccus flavus TaxID=2775968 RepID=UPI001CF6DA36|nr:hypothetical protein [Agilicoccus flavus]